MPAFHPRRHRISTIESLTAFVVSRAQDVGFLLRFLYIEAKFLYISYRQRDCLFHKL
jgi:hypothetical protein